METMTVDVKFEAVGDGGQIEGYAAVFGNVDSYGDVIEPGAFAETLQKRRPKMLWQHNMSEPIGVWDEYREDEHGLYVKGRLAQNVAKAQEARDLVKMGALDGLSIGYVTKEAKPDGNTRRLTRLDLYETSLVTEPANDAARVTSIKSVRDFERLLFEETDFSRSVAKAMAGAAWKRRGEILREAEQVTPEIDQREAEELKALLQQMTA